MSEISRADDFLFSQIKSGDQQGWHDLLQRYQGRLSAFARKQLRNASDCDDLVQETFLSFLNGIQRLELESSLETLLFTILRRRIIDFFRKSGQVNQVPVCRFGADDIAVEPIASSATASWYLRNEENRTVQEKILGNELHRLVLELQAESRLVDLQVWEMLFYAQMRNTDIATLLGIDEKQIALRKHRVVKRLAKSVAESSQMHALELENADQMLTSVWEALRPSCPKRSTLGKYTLGTLDEGWETFVRIHVDEIKCQFCVANLSDINTTNEKEVTSLNQKILQSSIGFFKPD